LKRTEVSLKLAAASVEADTDADLGNSQQTGDVAVAVAF